MENPTTRGILETTKKKVTGSLLGKQVGSTKAISRMTCAMAMVRCFGQTGTFIEEDGNKESKVERASFF